MTSRALKLIQILALVLIPSTSFAYGEGENIPESSRAVHLLTNEARCNVKEALKDCGASCKESAKCLSSGLYKEIEQPLYWDNDLFRAAQFQANMLSAANCMQHDSPCKLTSTAASDFPDRCDGNPSCACEGGKAQCGTKGTATFERIHLFSNKGFAENLASAGTPISSFNMWLFEKGDTEKCEFTGSNGHRYNILSAEYNLIGAGFASKIASQVIGKDKNAVNHPISAGSHYRDSNKLLWFKLHYAAETEIKSAAVSLNGTCTELKKTRGNKTNSVWGIENLTPEACTPYVFEVKDSTGNITRYPTTGSLLYQCDKSWSNTEIEGCYASAEGGNGNTPAEGGNGNNADSDGCSAAPRSSSGSTPLLLFLLPALLLFRRNKKA